MTNPRPLRVPAARYALTTIALISCSMLIWEILLTRICALRLYFHFGYLVVSNCLLAVGASGTMLTLLQDRWHARVREWVFTFSGLYALSLVGTYAFLLEFPIPVDLSLADASHLVRFSTYTLVSAVPFFFGGTVVGLLLSANPTDINRVYFLDLLGAGLGCLLTPALLAWVGAGGTLVTLVMLAVGCTLTSAPERGRRAAFAAGAVLLLAGLWLLPRLDTMFPVPGKGRLDLTSERMVELGYRTEYSRWSSNSRIDVLPLFPKQRFMFARGDAVKQRPLPDEKIIVQDGWAGTFILDLTNHPEALDIVAHSLYSATYQLKEGSDPDVLVIGAGGGLDLWAARHHGAASVRAIELNEQVIDVHRSHLPEWSRGLLEDPRVEFVHGEGRSTLERDPNRYDVIQMTGIDTWTALASGAYVLAENYLYTQEALRSMFEHLKPGGILQIVRFAADMEKLRLLSNAYAALGDREALDFQHSVAVLQTSDGLAATLIKNGTFTPRELEGLAEFARRSGITVVYLPSRRTNSIVERFIRSDDKATMIERFPRDISPTTDDRPYFFNFSKWKNPFVSTLHIKEPTNVSQGNPSFLLGQLAVSVAASAMLIVLPLLVFRRRGLERRHVGTFLTYFIGLGLGFIAIEISLMQKLTLFLGHPIYSITITLFSILIFTGFGALVSERWFLEDRIRVWPVPGLLLLVLGLFLATSPFVTKALIGWPLPARAALTIVGLAPVGLLLGIPFAYGIRLANRFNPSIVPWAWAVNACFTVIGSVATVIVSMNLGFRFVMLGAVAVYALSFLSLRRLPA